MATRYEIHPTVGVARLGDSPDSFFLAPEALGGRPLECDASGNEILVAGAPRPVERFKDQAGRIRRQAARFKLFAFDDADPAAGGREVTLDDAEVAGIEWTVHLANKKAAWYQGAQLDGDPMLGEWAGGTNTNSYQARHVPLRNRRIVDESERQRSLIVDPGPRTVREPDQRVACSRATVPADYPHGSFPDPSLGPYPIDSLGEVLVDAAGRLLVLGGHGDACGRRIIATFTGSDTWFDDVSDGPVTCRLRLRGGEVHQLEAWCLVGPPKYAPELRNIVTLDDVMFDAGVRFLGLLPELYDRERWPETGGWNRDYRASFERDVRPIMERPADYIWVANVPSMVGFAAPRFDPRDASAANRPNRERYLSYWRRPGENELGAEHEVLMSPQGVPLMPLNAGTNPVSNDNIDKMMSLTLTQYVLLEQWARGKFSAGDPADASGALEGVHPLDRASVGNCVGHPMSPGVETSWNTRNPTIYERSYVIKHRYGAAHYRTCGLSPSYDECLPGEDGVFQGCEPGDLTKRMSPPWQSDLYQCSIEYVSFKSPRVNQDDETQIPPPPTYYAYWWPPQAPMYVISGAMTPQEQRAAGVVGGYQVYFTRGANNINLLVSCWKDLGFVVNQNRGPDAREYPYYVEVERNHDRFVVGSVAVSQPIDQLAASGSYFTEDNYFIPVWYLRDEGGQGAARRGAGASSGR
jgi:L-lysine 6-oxidase